MQKHSKQYIFESMPVPQAIAKLAVPTILGMLVTVIYNLADTFFVGQIGDPNQVAAVTISMPIFMILMAFGNLFGVGSSSFISRLLGTKDYDTVKKTSAFSFYSCIIVGVIVAIVGSVFIEDILHLLGSSNNTFDFARQYLSVIFFGAPFVVLSFAMGQMIRAEGASKNAMIGMMLGTVINIILDPILILRFEMGVYGAAVATIFANCISVLYYIIYFIRRSEFLSISPKDYKPTTSIVKNILAIGTTASITNLLMSISSIILNNFAVEYGDTVVAAFGIINRILMLPALLSIGLCQGVQPLIGYNYAANNRERMNETMKITGIVGTVVAIIITVFLYFAGGNAVKVFIDDAHTIELGTQFLRNNLISIPFFGVLFLFSFTFQALGKAIPSLILAVSRQGFVFIPALIIGNMVFGLNGIVFAQPIADIFSAFMSVIMAMFVLKNQKDSKYKTEQKHEKS